MIIGARLFRFSLADLGFDRRYFIRNMGLGLCLGLFTFTIAYFLEFQILRSMGRSVVFQFYVTNFALTGSSSQATAAFLLLAICVAGNIINVLVEEGLFRGLFLKLGADRFGFSKSNWIQASLFGIWHIVMVVLGVREGLMDMSSAIVMAIGYVVLAGILGLLWGLCLSMTGSLWLGLSHHFFNNFIGNTLHVVTEVGADEMQIVRIVLSSLLSFFIVLIFRRSRLRIRLGST